jgi:ornithine cyclodeaminase/alanine dehydrogenase-like protein (mu-crystallin family)
MTVQRSRVVVDTDGGAGEEAMLISIKAGAIIRRHVRAELADLVSGARLGRATPCESTRSNSVGVLTEDERRALIGSR